MSGICYSSLHGSLTCRLRKVLLSSSLFFFPLFQLPFFDVTQDLIDFWDCLWRDHVEYCFCKVLGKLMKAFCNLRNSRYTLKCFYILFFFEYSWLWLLALTGRNTLYRSQDPMSPNCTFWKTGNFCAQHRDWIQGYNSALVFCWWHKPQELVGLWTAATTIHGDWITAYVFD